MKKEQYYFYSSHIQFTQLQIAALRFAKVGEFQVSNLRAQLSVFRGLGIYKSEVNYLGAVFGTNKRRRQHAAYTLVPDQVVGPGSPISCLC